MQTSLLRFELIRISQVLSFSQSLVVQNSWFSKVRSKVEQMRDRKESMILILLYYIINKKSQNIKY
jgi:hypothetical protein